MSQHPDTTGGSTARVSRRRALFTGAAAAAGGAGAAVLGGSFVAADRQETAVQRAVAAEQEAAAAHRSTFVGVETVSWSGRHQAGVTTSPRAHATFCAYDLRDGFGITELVKVLRILTEDIDRITGGRPALADTAPALAAVPARLTVTIGLGPSLFRKLDLEGKLPPGLEDLPDFPEIDKIEERYSGGDVLLHIAADDALTVAHSQRMVHKDVRAFLSTRWVQRGFLRSRGTAADSVTPRNLMGQLDGTVNPNTEQEFESLVWDESSGWFAGGTQMVFRRIRMDLDRWDELDPVAMDAVIGRRLTDGSPLTGTAEHDDPDFGAADATGLPAIAEDAHIRSARGDGAAHQILRHPLNFDDSPDESGESDLGQLFVSYQRSIVDQFVPMQRRLAAADLLNEWTTPVGTAVFAILPGVADGGYLGQSLIES